MRKIIGIVAVCGLGAVACTSTLQDLEGVEAIPPDEIQVYQSPDEFPNVAKVCIDGKGFALITRDYNSLTPVSEWDC